MSKSPPRIPAIPPPPKRSCLGIIFKAVAMLVIGFIGWCVWDAAISPRISTWGKHTKHPAFLYTCINGNRSVSVIGFSPDGSRFLTSGSKHALIHDAATGDKISEVKDHWQDGGYEISGDRSVITAKWSNRRTKEVELKVFDWDGELLRTIKMEDGARPNSVAMISKLKGGFASAEGGRVVVRDASGKRVVELPGDVGGYKLLSSADGNVVVAKGSGTFHVWKLDAADNVVTINSPESSSAQLSADGARLAAKSGSEVHVWSTADGSLLTTWKSDGLDLFSSALSPDGTLIAAGAKDGTIVVADAKSGDELYRFGNEMTPGSIAFSPRLDRIIAGLSYRSTVSGGEAIFPRKVGGHHNTQQRDHRRGTGIVRQSENRISRTPGYAIAWSLKSEPAVSP